MIAWLKKLWRAHRRRSRVRRKIRNLRRFYGSNMSLWPREARMLYWELDDQL